MNSMEHLGFCVFSASQIENLASYAEALRTCAYSGSLIEGKRIHAQLIRIGYGNKSLGNRLMELYAICHSLDDAHLVLKLMPRPRNVFAWNSIIAAYVREGNRELSLELFEQMQQEGTMANKFSYSILLTLFVFPEALVWGQRIHCNILISGLDSDVLVGTALVKMYARCGSLRIAGMVFDRLGCHRDVVCWTAMITAHAKNRISSEALLLLEQMQREGVEPNTVTFLGILGAFRNAKDLWRAKWMHACILFKEIDLDIILANAIISMYAKCESSGFAQSEFERMLERNIVTWNMIISMHAQEGNIMAAFYHFEKLQHVNMRPDKVTFLNILGVCDAPELVTHAKILHAYIISDGDRIDIEIATCLTDTYGKCGNLDMAGNIFEHMEKHNIISWNALLTAYTHNEYNRETFYLFKQMQEGGILPDSVTFINILNACSSLADLPRGKWMHGYIIGTSFLLDNIVRTALLNLYGKCGCVAIAKEEFDMIHEPDMVSWTAMVSVYAYNGFCKLALHLFKLMRTEGIIPNQATFLAAIDACASVAALVEGRRIHTCIISSGLQWDVILSTALLNMYGKCGRWGDVSELLWYTPGHNVVTWSALIVACAQNGHANDAIQLVGRMLINGMIPNDICFIGLLCACSYANRLHDGCHWFMFMGQALHMAVGVQHYGCLIDLVGKMGWKDETIDIIANMWCQPTDTMWVSMLGACQVHDDFDVG